MNIFEVSEYHFAEWRFISCFFSSLSYNNCL